MKKTKFFLPVALLGLACSLIACSGQPSEESKQSQGGDTSQTSQQQGTEEKIKVTAAEGKVRLFLGETVQLTASIDGVSWSTSDDKIATVSARNWNSKNKLGRKLMWLSLRFQQTSG